ncbi:MAG: 4-alpha-glucanotransferase, partial [Deltaproteobacteria bacterium]
WGNPLYRWEAMAATGYAWWTLRFRLLLELVDVVRLDHFRGFEAYWEIPAHEATAVNGRWRKGPGEDFFERIGAALGDLPIIAEDLGLITPEVEVLRDRFGFPGMKILQFAFGDTPQNGYLPHNFRPECVVYTGTHDNDTIGGWFRSAPRALQREVCGYLGSEGGEIHWDFIRLGLSSVARLAIFPIQDILGLGSEARMNTPGKEKGNWTWRLTEAELSTAPFSRLQILTHRYGR